MSEDKQNPYLMPGAVVVAGLFIAMALFMSGDGLLNGGTGDTADTGAAAEAATPADIAKAIGLNTKDFSKCLEEGRYAATVEADNQNAIAIGGAGTPFSVLINSEGTKYPVYGAYPLEQLKGFIDGALANDQAQLASLEEQSGLSISDEMRAVNADDHIRGDLNAKVKLVVYTDMQCPFCAQFHATALQALDAYSGQMALVYRHFPLDALHPTTRMLSEGSECAAELGGGEAFWAFFDKAFAE
ncbi:MAG: thioredoxin domain-containing protein [Candidatus Colwellbacteria bacterium]|nr:thioredoxin domain-containing protein [Candidatus Colwellbacteria bacterium]